MRPRTAAWPARLGIGRPALNKVLFVSYGAFDCNSAGHIAGFAGELKRRGLAVGVCGRDRIFNVHAFGPAPFEFFTVQDLSSDPKGVIGFDGRFEPARTAMICWTPRKLARQAVARVSRQHGVPYIVHLEDNEDHLSRLRFAAGRLGEEAEVKDRAERTALLYGAMGASIIEQRLAETLPPDLPSLLLEPGVDMGQFETPLAPHRRATLLRMAGATPEATVIVYPGNIHRANLDEMVELYRAVALLRERGREVVLIKTGQDDVSVAEPLGFDPRNHGVLTLGQVERPFLIELMKCADLFIQPGAPGPFNDFRLPSKLPEFLAVGRPVILPKANVGLRLRHGVDALLLERGTADEIMGLVDAVMADPSLAKRLGLNGQAFARRTYRWDRQGRKLADFLVGLHGSRPK